MLIQLVRYSAAGRPDDSLGAGGRRLLSLPINSLDFALLQPDGKLLLAASGGSGLVLLRLTPLSDARLAFFPLFWNCWHSETNPAPGCP